VRSWTLQRHRNIGIHFENPSRPDTANMTEVEIPKQCKAGVVVNEGPDFRIEVQMVDVPEPGGR